MRVPFLTSIAVIMAPWAAAHAADAVSPTGTASTAAAQWWAPLTLSVDLDLAVGTGTFVASRFADDPYYASTLALRPGWRLSEDVTVSMSLALDFEWTSLVTPCHAASGPRAAGAPAEDCSATSDPNGRSADLRDLSLSIAHAHLYAFEGAVLSASGGVELPTSRASRAATNILTVGAQMTVERPIAAFTPAISLGFSKYFPRDDAPLADPGEGAVPIGRCRGTRSTDCLLLAGFVPSWRFGVDLSVSAALPRGFDATIAVGYAYTSNFGRPLDARSSTLLDGSGARVVDGGGAADATNGSLELGYAAHETVRVAIGVASAQPARTADNSALRFPFFDFISPANNYSAWYAAVSWTPL